MDDDRFLNHKPLCYFSGQVIIVSKPSSSSSAQRATSLCLPKILSTDPESKRKARWDAPCLLTCSALPIPTKISVGPVGNGTRSCSKPRAAADAWEDVPSTHICLDYFCNYPHKGFPRHIWPTEVPDESSSALLTLPGRTCVIPITCWELSASPLAFWWNCLKMCSG